ncbi:MAG: DNA phosphorothioation-associated protein 4 [Cyanobacteria bacterium J06638_28]
MALTRIHVAEDKAELVRSLRASEVNTGPFRTYADVVSFAAIVGFHHSRRASFDSHSRKEPDPVPQEQFRNANIIGLVALADSQDPAILRDDDESDRRRVEIFQEYVNGGLEILAAELSGTVDYAEQLLLMLKVQKEMGQSDQEFDLSRFL